MGVLECDTIGNCKISLDQIGIFFQKTISIKGLQNNEKFFSIRYNLIEEYQKLKIKSRNNQFFYYVKDCKCISDFTPFEQEKEIFIKWVKILYDIHNIKEFNYIQTRKIDNDKFFQKNLEKTFLNNKKYFLKLVTMGVPSNLRQFIWTIIIDKDEKDISNVSNIEKEKIYFQTLLSLNKVSKDIEQIEKDITRTFLGEENTKENIITLKKILIALNNLDEKIGYCQGINFIISLILKITKFNMIKTFHLARLILKRIKGYFTKDFPLLKHNLKKFDKSFGQLFHKLFNHFKQNDIVNEIYVGKWIQTLFAVSLNFENACHIWDALLVYGMDFIIPISLSILYLTKDNLLSLNDSTDIVKFLEKTLKPNEESLMKKIYNENVELKDYIIPIRDIISNAKKIRNQLNLGPHDGNEYSQRNKIDLRESLILRNSLTSNGTCSFEKKMEQIKSQKLNEKMNSYETPQNNSRINNNIRVNKFYTTYHKNNDPKDKNISNINNYIKLNNRQRCLSFELDNKDIKNNLYINNNNFNVNKINANEQYPKNIYIRSNKFDRNNMDGFNNINSLNSINNINYFSSMNNPINKINFQNLNYFCNNLNSFNGCNIKNINIFDNNLSPNKTNFNNEINYNVNNPVINININYNPIYYNIIQSNSNPNIFRKNIKTPEVNKIKLREKIYNQMHNRRNNLDIDYLSNGINEFSEGEKYKNEIRNFNNIRIIM